MTPTEHAKELRRQQSAITRMVHKLAKVPTLAEKIVLKRKIAAARETLRQHKLNYHTLTE